MASQRERHEYQTGEKSIVKFISVLATALAVALIPAASSAADMAEANIVNADGAIIGTTTFEQTPTGVLVYVDVRDLPPGPHGIHLHATGSCSLDFKAAMGHINPGQVAHGLRKPGRSRQRRSAESLCGCRWHCESGVLHLAGLGLGRGDAGTSRRGRLSGYHSRHARRSPDPADRRCRRADRLRDHLEGAMRGVYSSCPPER